MLNRRASVLIIDADLEFRRALAHALEEAGCVAAEAVTFSDALERLEGFAYDGLIVDVRVPGGDGLDVLDAAIGRYPTMKCVVTANFGSIHHAVRALKRGAMDYLIKPMPASQMVSGLVAALTERQELPVAAEPVRRDESPFPGIVGRSPSMQQLFQTVNRVAGMQSVVLIQGETGTGKELIAKTIHENSSRREHPFVAFNAAAIPEGLIEAELFGHVKGAFTGAVYTRVGRFEAADRGTLFIDEVSSMPVALQAKLLRALQEREIERVGTSRPMKVNVRIVAATNVDLAELVREGRFREDLYYRLNVVRLTVPPLRERKDDISLLARHFVDLSCAVNGVSRKELTQAALQTLMDYSWPGNVRHLQNAIESAIVMTGAETEIHPQAFPAEVLQGIEPLRQARTPAAATVVPAVSDDGINLNSMMSQIERELILTYLKRAGGNKRRAARMLMLSRTTLIDKLNRLGVRDESATASPVEAVA